MTDSAFQLSAAERRALRARAHPLHPVVIVGSKGLTDAVLKEVDSALKSHGLIKLRLATVDREERAAQLAHLCAALAAVPVQNIGKIAVLYREIVDTPERPMPRSKSSAKRRPARRLASAPRPRGQDHPDRPAPKRARPSRRPVANPHNGKSDPSAPARKPRSRA